MSAGLLSIILSFVINVAPGGSIKDALEKARTVEGPVEIVLAEGTWQISRPILLTEDDSRPADRPLVIRGAGMGKTIVSSGRKAAFHDSGKGFWTVDVAEITPGVDNIEQFFVNGRAAVRARTPNGLDMFPSTRCDLVQIDSIGPRDYSRKGFAAMKFRLTDEAAEALSGVEIPSSVKVTVHHGWSVTSRNISSFDPALKTICFSGLAYKPWNPFARKDGSSHFFLEDDMAFLDAPGEFYHDRANSLIYYIPREGETLENSTAVIPVCEHLIMIDGCNGPLVIQDMSFRDTRRHVDWWGRNDKQAAADMDAAVMLEHSRGIQLKDCEIACTANYALMFGEGTSHCGISGSWLHDLGAGGVRVGVGTVGIRPEDVASHISIIDNIIEEGGKVYPAGVGVLMMHASDCEVTHNDIANFFYTGVSVGWVWGYADSPSKCNHIVANHIHDIGKSVLSDMGGVYTLGKSEGTLVSGNVIHDVISVGYGGWGLYTDEGSTGVTMEKNLVYDCKHAGYHHHYGCENYIRNNLFLDSREDQLAATRVEDHISYYFENNIVCYNTNSSDILYRKWAEMNAVCDRNLYWNAAGPVILGGLDIEQWRSRTGKDIHSVVADPRIKRNADGTVTIGNPKALRKIGFVIPDWASAGPSEDTKVRAAACGR